MVVPAGTNIDGITASPTGALYGNSYVYVTGNQGSSATFTLAGNQNAFGLTWGTIDTYNTLTLNTTLGQYVITGNDLLAALSGLGVPYSLSGNNAVDPNNNNQGLQADVVFHDLGGYITSAVLTSSQNSFEAGNFSAVPLPPAFVLFASGLIAMAGFSMYKKARDQA